MRPRRLERFCELQNFLSWIIPAWDRSTVVTDVAGDQDSKSGKHRRQLRCTTLFILLLVLVLEAT